MQGQTGRLQDVRLCCLKGEKFVLGMWEQVEPPAFVCTCSLPAKREIPVWQESENRQCGCDAEREKQLQYVFSLIFHETSVQQCKLLKHNRVPFS